MTSRTCHYFESCMKHFYRNSRPNMRESKPTCFKNRYQTLYVSLRDWKPLGHIPTNRKDKHLGYNISN